MKRRVLVTGPAHGTAAWLTAAVRAGWEPLALPLVETVPLPGVDLLRGLERAPDWICVTSSSALFALEPCRATWGVVRCAAVGKRTAERLRGLGFAVALEGSGTAADLAAALAPRLAPTDLVLWPRGALAEELGERLAASGVDVRAPIVYETRERELQGLPAADAVLVASPSAVRVLARAADRVPATLFAIGSKTAGAARERGLAPPARLVVLESPDPAAFERALRTAAG